MIMMTFSNFVRIYNLKNRAASNIKIQQVLSSLSLNDVGIYLGDGQFESDIGIVNLHPSRGSHWVCYINENYFDSNGCSPPKKLSKFVVKRNGYCLYSEYQIQKNDSLYIYIILFIYNLFGERFRNRF